MNFSSKRGVMAAVLSDAELCRSSMIECQVIVAPGFPLQLFCWLAQGRVDIAQGA
jgi:hypothetical protein